MKGRDHDQVSAAHNMTNLFIRMHLSGFALGGFFDQFYEMNKKKVCSVYPFVLRLRVEFNSIQIKRCGFLFVLHLIKKIQFYGFSFPLNKCMKPQSTAPMWSTNVNIFSNGFNFIFKYLINAYICA